MESSGNFFFIYTYWKFTLSTENFVSKIPDVKTLHLNISCNRTKQCYGKFLKFWTLFLFLFANKMLVFRAVGQNSKQRRPWSDCFWWSSLIWVCAASLGLFGRQLVFKILEQNIVIYLICLYYRNYRGQLIRFCFILHMHKSLLKHAYTAM